MVKNNRIVYMDVLRVIACFAVIMIHSSSTYVIENLGSLNFWIGNIFDGLARIGVPLFVMVSGALMLDEKYDFSAQKLIEHIKKMIIFFIFWSCFYCVIFKIIIPLTENANISCVDILVNLVSGEYHLWFVYLIIGLYLIVPLLRLWVNKNNKKYVEYFIVLSLIFTYILPQIVSIAVNFCGLFWALNTILDNYLSLKYIGGFTTYFILGWYLNNYDIKNKKNVYALGLISLAITIFGTYILSYNTGKMLQMSF